MTPATRSLSPEFLTALRSGLLSPVVERVRSDRSLCLELRGEYVNVYYRGGSLMKVSRSGDAYRAFFDAKYFVGRGEPRVVPTAELKTPADVDRWLAAVPALKEAMDLKGPKEEREIQQLILRDNNFGSVARSTDYYVCDIEYANDYGRFDIVAVRWPSTSTARKRQDGHRLTFAEVKQGDAALDGEAGLHAHIIDVNRCLAEPDNVMAIKSEMVETFNRKRSLGLIDCQKDLAAFSDEPPLLLLMLANHDPAKPRLRELLRTLPESPYAELRITCSSLMGYGLYEPGVLRIEQALARFGDSI